jgi:hypothetical protein
MASNIARSLRSLGGVVISGSWVVVFCAGTIAIELVDVSAESHRVGAPLAGESRLKLASAAVAERKLDRDPRSAAGRAVQRQPSFESVDAVDQTREP